MDEPLNKKARNDCDPRELFPEVCYPRNDAAWERLTKCDAQGEPCAIDLSGLRRPSARALSDALEITGAVRGNAELTLTCPGSYRENSNPATPDTGVTVPANQFLRFVEDQEDIAALAAAQAVVDALAETFAQSQLTCFAWNTEQTENCQVTGDLLDTARTTSATIAANTTRASMRDVLQVDGEAELLALTVESVALDDFVVRRDIAEPNYYQVLDFSGPGSTATYAAPVTRVVAYTTLHVLDLVVANAGASAAASAALDCVWGNEAETVECPQDDSAVPASALTTTGRPTNTIAPLTFTYGPAELGAPPDVTAAAKDQAMAGLICVYGSNEQTVACAEADDAGTPVAAIGGTVGAPLSNTVEANAFTTTITFVPGVDDPAALVFPAAEDNRDELDAQALALADAQLQCFYGNTAESSVCAPDVTSVLCTTATQDYTVSELTADFTNPVTDCAVALTKNTSVGVVVEKTYLPLVDSDAVADGLNTTILDGCLTDDPDSAANEAALLAAIDSRCSVAGGWIESGPFGVDAEQSYEGAVDKNLFIRLSTDNANTTAAQIAFDAASSAAADFLAGTLLCLWSNIEVPPLDCHPVAFQDEGNNIRAHYSPERPSRRICTGEFTSPISKLDAQRAAWAAAYASRECVPTQLGNETILIECPVHPAIEDTEIPDTMKPVPVPNQFTEDEDPPVTDPPYEYIPYVIDADSFFGRTEYEATQLAKTVGCGARTCVWTNKQQTADECPELFTQFGDPVEIPEGAFITLTEVENPNSLASDLANALNICLPIDEVGDSTAGFYPDSSTGACGNAPFQICASISDPCGSVPLVTYTVEGGDITQSGSGASASLSQTGETNQDADGFNADIYVLVAFTYDGSTSKVNISDADWSSPTGSAAMIPSVSGSVSDGYVGFIYIGNVKTVREVMETPHIVCYRLVVSQAHLGDVEWPDLYRVVLCVPGDDIEYTVVAGGGSETVDLSYD